MVLALAAIGALCLVALNWTWGRLPAEPARTGTVVHVDGTSVRVIDRPGRGTAVVLLHGLPGTAEDFGGVTRRLAGRRTIAIDRPGYGYSSEGYVPLARQAEVVHRLLHRLGVRHAIVVGHSYGGTLALELAERHPADVAGLVLANTAATGFRLGDLERARGRLVELLNAPGIRTLAGATFSQALFRAAGGGADRRAFEPAPVDPAHRERLLALNMTPGDLEAMTGETRALGSAVRRVDLRLATIRRPAVVVQADRDGLVQPRHGRRLAAALPDARLVTVPGGHMTPITHPAVIAAAIADVLGVRNPHRAGGPLAASRGPRAAQQGR